MKNMRELILPYLNIDSVKLISNNFKYLSNLKMLELRNIILILDCDKDSEIELINNLKYLPKLNIISCNSIYINIGELSKKYYNLGENILKNINNDELCVQNNIGDLGMYYIIDLLKDMNNLKSLDLSCIIIYK